MQRQIRRGKAKRDGFARRVMAVSERTSKARCPNRRANSAELRQKLCRELSLPPRISANALLDMINKVYGAEEYKDAVKKIRGTV